MWFTNKREHGSILSMKNLGSEFFLKNTENLKPTIFSGKSEKLSDTFLGSSRKLHFLKCSSELFYMESIENFC